MAVNNPLADMDAQAGLLSAAAKDPAIRARVLATLMQSDFCGADRELFKILVMENGPVLPDNLSKEANDRLLEVEGKLRIMPTGEDVEKWIATLLNTRALTDQKALLLTQLEAIKPGVQAQQIAGGTVSGTARIMATVDQRDTVTMSDLIRDGEALYTRWQAGDSYAGLVQTGIAELDRMLGGLVPEHVTVFGARPSMAKTSLALQILRNVALRTKAEGKDQQAVFVSLDMSPVMLGFRLASAASGVNWKDVRNRKEGARTEDWLHALQGLDGLPLIIKKRPHPTAQDVMQMVEVEAAAHKDGISLIVLDFIELMRGEGTNETAQVSNIIIGAKVVAQRYHCPVIALSQLSREVEKLPTRLPEKSHLRQSGMIEAVAQQICMLYYPDGYQTRSQALNDSYPTKELAQQAGRLHERGANYLIKIEKNRDDEAGLAVPLLFDPTLTRFDGPNTVTLQRMRKARE